MTDDAPKRMIEIGVLPTGGGEIFYEGVDPIVLMLKDADMRLAAERAAATKTIAVKAADIERTKATRRARALRNLTRALKTFARLR
jgi:hypothetical protein